MEQPFRLIAHGSPEYDCACELRQALLRSPLGLDLYAEDLAAEAAALHFGGFSPTGQLVAYVLASPLPAAVQLRQMVVATAYQGQGVGAALLAAAEAQLQQRGVCQVVLHARQSAVGFYQKSGYSCQGEAFIEVGLPHFRMAKML